MNFRDIKPSLQLLNLLCRIERFCGRWERFFESESQGNLTASSRTRLAILEGSCAMVALDSTSSPSAELVARRLRSILLEDVNTESPRGDNSPSGNSNRASSIVPSPLQALVLAHETHFAPDYWGIFQLYQAIAASGDLYLGPGSSLGEPSLRDSSLRFLAPNSQEVFPTVSPFLLPVRLRELLEWVEDASAEENNHPLVVAGVFYLCFLQLSPFPKANHSVAQLALWHFLSRHSYSFVRYKHPAVIFAQTQESYFTSLRQAEKTVGSNWATINSWLIFFASSLWQCCCAMQQETKLSFSLSRLSATQRDIIEVVRDRGSASREVIASQTGIKLSTIKYNLSLLTNNGHLKREGNGRTTCYSVV